MNKTTGFGNAAFGTRALQNVTTGHSNTAMGSSYGGYAGGAITTGTFNVMLGTDAGYAVTTGGDNTCVGAGAGISITTGGNNTIIGQGCNANSNNCNAIVLGHEVTSQSDYFYFGKAEMLFTTTLHQTPVGHVHLTNAGKKILPITQTAASTLSTTYEQSPISGKPRQN